ncbi:hypothetical protein ACFQFH_11570 [Halobaculum halobium]|uniref:Pyroglutamyl-peptidase I n=1 Tax=Halobaculum halobium TaxID=3032281 RepID=A0ABD5TB48_9EURY|nr:hypothetical protein [Halobaculum sp. SYNS20]
MTLLCTGYEPFDDHEVNPSGELAEALDGRTVAGHEVVGRVLPVAFDAAEARMADLLDEHDPAVVVATGLAAGRTAVCVERVAINVADTVGVPDNAGNDPVDERLDPTGPDARRSTIPVRETVQACLDAGVPARASNTAGTHLCNGILYETLSLLEGTDTSAGFLHLPATPEQAATTASEGEAARGGSVRPSLPRALDERAVEQAFATALEAKDCRRRDALRAVAPPDAASQPLGAGRNEPLLGVDRRTAVGDGSLGGPPVGCSDVSRDRACPVCFARFTRLTSQRPAAALGDPEDLLVGYRLHEPTLCKRRHPTLHQRDVEPGVGGDERRVVRARPAQVAQDSLVGVGEVGGLGHLFAVYVTVTHEVVADSRPRRNGPRTPAEIRELKAVASNAGLCDCRTRPWATHRRAASDGTC